MASMLADVDLEGVDGGRGAMWLTGLGLSTDWEAREAKREAFLAKVGEYSAGDGADADLDPLAKVSSDLCRYCCQKPAYITTTKPTPRRSRLCKRLVGTCGRFCSLQA